jgi:hypothetical protein
MAIAINNSDDELCPNCGEFVPYLYEDTGFCYPCSGIEPTRRCSICNDILPDEHEHQECNRCRLETWLNKNANKIERIMVQENISAWKARWVVVESNRPFCLSCGNRIKGGQLGRHFFCRTNRVCKKASNVYQYHREKNKSHEDAVKKAIEAAYIIKLTGGING